MATDQQHAQNMPTLLDDAAQTEPREGFGAEFRELARQRRFQRRTVEVIKQSRAQAAATAPRPAHRLRQPTDVARPQAPRPQTAPPLAPDATTGAPPVSHDAAPASFTAAAGAYATERERLTDTARGVVSEMSRMADRIIEAREAVAVERARANRAERDLATANDRIMASRVLVHEAQRTARIAAERCAYLEGFCEALEDSLDTVLAGSWLARWRHRRHDRTTA
jgi:hypothetical protein